MADDQRDRSSEWGMGAGWSVVGTLVSGMAVWGGIGWLVDWWLGTGFALPLGVVLGTVGAIYLIFKRFAHLSDE